MLQAAQWKISLDNTNAFQMVKALVLGKPLVDEELLFKQGKGPLCMAGASKDFHFVAARAAIRASKMLVKGRDACGDNAGKRTRSGNGRASCLKNEVPGHSRICSMEI